MELLREKVAIVTGGARDIGAAISIKLAQTGAKVCINYLNNKDAAEATLAAIKNAGGIVIIAQGDVTKSADVTKIVD